MDRPAIASQITFLYTRDLSRSAHFYGELLGLPLWLDQGTCRIYQVTGTALVGICQTGTGAAQSATINEKQTNVIFTLVTDEVDAWYHYLLAQGIVFEKSPAMNEQYRIYHCFLRDPDGYLIEIQRFLNPPPLPVRD